MSSLCAEVTKYLRWRMAKGPLAHKPSSHTLGGFVVKLSTPLISISRHHFFLWTCLGPFQLTYISRLLPTISLSLSLSLIFQFINKIWLSTCVYVCLSIPVSVSPFWHPLSSIYSGFYTASSVHPFLYIIYLCRLLHSNNNGFFLYIKYF